MSTPPPPPNIRRRFKVPGGGAGRRRFRAWGLLAVAGLLAGVVGLASLSNTAEGQRRTVNAPTGLTVSNITNTGATLSWTKGAAGECPTKNYDVTVMLASNLKVAWVRDEFKKTTVNVTGLSAGTTYRVEVHAYSNKCGDYSAAVRRVFTTTGTTTGTATATATPTPVVATPNAPTGFTISSITDTTATLSWTKGAAGKCPTKNYDVAVMLASNLKVVWVRDEFKKTTVNVTGLSAGTGYRVQLLAYGNKCGQYSAGVEREFTTATATATNTPTPEPTTTGNPNEPTGFAAGSITETGAALSWTAGAAGDCTTTEYSVRVAHAPWAGEGSALGGSMVRTVWGPQDVTGTSATVTGLSRATIYVAEIFAYGESCDNYSPFVFVKFITDGIPAKPAGLTAMGGERQATLSWTDLSDTTVRRWEYQQKAGNGSYGSWIAMGSSSATTTRHTVTGLAGGTTYAFQVRAVNPAGNSPASDEVTARTAPAKPTSVTATGGARQVALGWANPSDATITSWEYQQKTGAGSYGAWMAIGSSSATTTAHTVTGLSDGTTYAFKVRAVNASGNGDASDEVTAATIPAKPTGVTATGGVRAAALGWANPGGATITSWEYQRKAGSGNYGSWTAIPSSSATTTGYTVTGLTAGTVYAFKVRAVNASGNGPASDEATAATAPAKPTGATATAGAQRVILAWADPGYASITRWEYQQKQGSGAYGSWTAIPGSSAITTTYTVRGLLAETTYGFKVRAVNAAGNGVASDEVTATTPMFVLVPGEPTATPAAGAGATPTGTPTATPTPTATSTATPTPTPPPSDAPDTGAGDTDDDEPPEPDTGAGDTDDDEPPEPDMDAGDTDADEPAEPDTGAGDRDADEPSAPDTGAGGDVADAEPDIGDTGSGLGTGAGVSLAAISGVIALALALALGGPAWARRRR